VPGDLKKLVPFWHTCHPNGRERVPGGSPAAASLGSVAGSSGFPTAQPSSRFLRTWKGRGPGCCLRTAVSTGRTALPCRCQLRSHRCVLLSSSLSCTSPAASQGPCTQTGDFCPVERGVGCSGEAAQPGWVAVGAGAALWAQLGCCGAPFPEAAAESLAWCGRAQVRGQQTGWCHWPSSGTGVGEQWLGSATGQKVNLTQSSTHGPRAEPT